MQLNTVFTDKQSDFMRNEITSMKQIVQIKSSFNSIEALLVISLAVRSVKWRTIVKFLRTHNYIQINQSN